MKLSENHNKLINHFLLFLDRHRYPDYNPSFEDKVAFIKYQSYGQSKLTESEKENIKPLIEAQKFGKEVCIKGLVEDMALFWSNGWGWYPPLAADIDIWFKERHKHKDRIYISALIKIARNITANGFVDYLSRFTGFNSNYKNRVFEKYETMGKR